MPLVLADVVSTSVSTVSWDLSTLNIPSSYNVYVEIPDTTESTLNLDNIANTRTAGGEFSVGYDITSLQNINISMITSGPLVSTVQTDPYSYIYWSLVWKNPDNEEIEVLSQEDSAKQNTLILYRHRPATTGISVSMEYNFKIITEDYITKPADRYEMAITIKAEVR